MTKARRVLVRVAKAFVAIAVVAWLTWFVVSLWAEREFEAKVSELRERGVRVDLADFHRTPPFDSDNGATLLRDAIAALPEYALEEPHGAYLIEDLDESGDEGAVDAAEEWAAVEKWVDGLALWYAAVDRAARLPRLDFGLDTSDWLDMSIESFPIGDKIRQTHYWAIRVLERRGGDPVEAVRKCETVFAYARKIEPDLVIGFLVSITINLSACDLVPHVVNIPTINIESARRTLDPLLAGAEDDRDRLRNALAAEFAGLVEVARLRTTWSFARRLIPDESTATVFHLLMRRDRLWRAATREIERWEAARALIEADGEHAWHELREFVDASQRESWVPQGVGIVFHQMLPNVQKARLRLRAHVRVARLGLAALERRQVTSTWPQSPEELAPLFPEGVPVDPFTRELFEFKIDDGSLLIEAAVPWLDARGDEFREDARIYWKLEAPK